MEFIIKALKERMPSIEENDSNNAKMAALAYQTYEIVEE